MKCAKEMMILYAVTDRSWLGGKALKEQVKEALDGGITCLQLREKNMPDDEFLAEALEIGSLCKEYNVPFIINDNIDVAVKCKADGVHVGQSDMSAKDVRRIIGNDMILGVSAQTVEQAADAVENGADYLGVGAVFSTSTKLDADSVSFDTLREICGSVCVPVVAIGGISGYNIHKLKGSGVDGVALVSAIFASDDITASCKKLKKLSEEMIANEN